MARELEPRVTFDDPLRSFHPIIPVHLKIRAHCQILGISICFVELGYPRFIGYDLLFSLICTLAIHLGDWAGNARLKALTSFVRRLPELPSVFVESSVAVVANYKRSRL